MNPLHIILSFCLSCLPAAQIPSACAEIAHQVQKITPSSLTDQEALQLQEALHKATNECLLTPSIVQIDQALISFNQRFRQAHEHPQSKT